MEKDFHLHFSARDVLLLVTGCSDSDSDLASLESVDLSGQINHYIYHHVEARNGREDSKEVQVRDGRSQDYSFVNLDGKRLATLADYPYPTSGERNLL